MIRTANHIFVSIETTAFSGATLLALLLGTHPEIATIGEISGLIATNNPETYRCSCGERIRDCKFWQVVTANMRARGLDFDVADFGTKFKLGGPHFIQRLREGSVRNAKIDRLRDRLLFSIPSEQEQIKALVSRNVGLIEAVLEVTGKSIFLDSSKSRMRLRALNHFSSLGIGVLHLVRRPEGVVASQLRRGRPGDAALHARGWRQRHRRLLVSYEDAQTGQYLRVRYEDLCLETEETLKKIFQFLKVSDTIEVLDFQKVSQHVIGNSMRLKPLSEIKLDERWRDELNPKQLQAIQDVTQSLSRKFGYS